MNWDSLSDKSDKLWKRMLGDTGATAGDPQLEELARKLSGGVRLRSKIEAQERFDHAAAYSRNIAPPRRRAVFFVRASAAVMLLLTMSAGLLYLQRGRQSSVMTGEIRPGSTKAFLVTHNGQKIALEGEQGLIAEQNGTMIQVDSRGLFYESTPEEVTRTIHNTLIIPRGGEYFVTLSDGTKVWLNSDSRLTYPVNFTGNIREVSVTGEAYFEVVHNDMPFVVATRRGRITVLGTEFNVNAYAESRETITTLVRGSIVYSAPDGTETVLSPGEQIAVWGTDHQVSKVDTRYAVSWKEGLFLFQEKRLEEIVQQLERWYDVRAYYTNETVKELRFTGDLSRFKEISTFIEILENSSDIKIKVDGRNLIIGL